MDGQQRLTSLYLLHWVLACRTAKIDKFGFLKPFTYATRNSANEFFRLLKKPNNELIELAKGSNFENKIKNYPWYLAEWNHDPTVQSALRFVDELCKKLEKQYDYNEMYERLVRNNVITFHLFEENSGGNTEAAAIKYIRMNARGKELTTFENIKAMLDSIIEKNNLKSNITDDYDKKYIDIFYSIAKLKYPNAKLKSVDVQMLNSFIDEKSLAFFKNVHNIARSILRHDTKVYKDFEYLNELYEDSQKNALNIEFYEIYFDLINSILYHCQNTTTRNMMKCLFDESFNIIENRKETAFALYMYHIGLCKDDISESLKIFSYILDNLNYGDWKELYYLVSYEFIKRIAYINCPILFFSSVTEDIFEIDGMIDVLDDIKVRIQEQHIKARSIILYQKDFRFFEQLEKNQRNEKFNTYFIFLIYGRGTIQISKRKMWIVS